MSAATATTSILDFADPIQDVLGIPRAPPRGYSSRTTSLPGRYQDVRNRIPDTTKARALLGFETKVGSRRRPRTDDRLAHAAARMPDAALASS